MSAQQSSVSRLAQSNPEYRIALEEYRNATSLEAGAKHLCVAAALRRPHTPPILSRVWHASGGVTSGSLLDRLAVALLRGRDLASVLQRHDEHHAVLRAHAEQCKQWVTYRESVLMAMEAEDRPSRHHGAGAHPLDTSDHA